MARVALVGNLPDRFGPKSRELLALEHERQCPFPTPLAIVERPPRSIDVFGHTGATPDGSRETADQRVLKPL